MSIHLVALHQLRGGAGVNVTRFLFSFSPPSRFFVFCSTRASLSLALSLSLPPPLSLSLSPPPTPLTAAFPASSHHHIARSPFLRVHFFFKEKYYRVFLDQQKEKRITMASTEDKAAKQESATGWKDSFYNPRTGEVLGRTGSSWALILLFYLVFYCFLAGMFALTMWVLLLTLDDYVPKYRDRVPYPGLVIRPNSLDLSFNKSDPLKYVQYVKHLESFLQRYNDSQQDKNDDCPPGEYFLQDDTEDMSKKACLFKRGFLSLCSGLSDTNFGYSEGKPCVLLKMNRIIGLKPRGDPYINCTVKVNTFSPRYSTCRSYLYVYCFFILSLSRIPDVHNSVNIFFLLIFHVVLLFVVFLCPISFCMLSLTALGETPRFKCSISPVRDALTRSISPTTARRPTRATFSPWWPWSCCSPRTTTTRSCRWSAGWRARTSATTTKGISSWVVLLSGSRWSSNRDGPPRRMETSRRARHVYGGFVFKGKGKKCQNVSQRRHLA
uniref:Sodium/potassium-transporting ATPase subunit beta-3 n=1 Tax=Gasterosteus aculeatus aculeatus TaxID=481459 RepID=A0AAQ4RET9_GASAC